MNSEECKVMSYDEKIQKAESIIAQLEQSDAISMETYKKQAAEATKLLQECRAEITSTNS